MLSKGKFNRVVRSHEALFLGFLAGGIFGVLILVMTSISVKHEDWKIPITHCGSVKNVQSVSFSYTGKIKKVVCKDKRTFTNF